MGVTSFCQIAAEVDLVGALLSLAEPKMLQAIIGRVSLDPTQKLDHKIG